MKLKYEIEPRNFPQQFQQFIEEFSFLDREEFLEIFFFHETQAIILSS